MKEQRISQIRARNESNLECICFTVQDRKSFWKILKMKEDTQCLVRTFKICKENVTGIPAVLLYAPAFLPMILCPQIQNCKNWTAGSFATCFAPFLTRTGQPEVVLLSSQKKEMNIPWGKKKNKPHFIWVLLCSCFFKSEMETLHTILHCCSHPRISCPKYSPLSPPEPLNREHASIHTHTQPSTQQTHLNKKSSRVLWQEPQRHTAVVPFYDTTPRTYILCLSVVSGRSAWLMRLITENQAVPKVPKLPLQLIFSDLAASAKSSIHAA